LYGIRFDPRFPLTLRFYNHCPPFRTKPLPYNLLDRFAQMARPVATGIAPAPTDIRGFRHPRLIGSQRAKNAVRLNGRPRLEQRKKCVTSNSNTNCCNAPIECISCDHSALMHSRKMEQVSKRAASLEQRRAYLRIFGGVTLLPQSHARWTGSEISGTQLSPAEHWRDSLLQPLSALQASPPPLLHRQRRCQMSIYAARPMA
jgi:hypothetical protein